MAWAALFTVKKWRVEGVGEKGKEGWEPGGHTQPSAPTQLDSAAGHWLGHLRAGPIFPWDTSSIRQSETLRPACSPLPPSCFISPGLPKFTPSDFSQLRG